MRGIKLNFVVAIALLSVFFCTPPAASQTGSDKIEAKVLSDLRMSRTVTFFVVLGEQADLRQAAAVRDWKSRGEAVVNSLRETAGRTQTPLLDFLQRFNAEVTPFWIVNTIKVTTSDEQLIHRLAALPNVALIKADKIWQLPEPAPAAQEPTIQSVEWGVSRVHAPDVWTQFGARGQGIVVASIDTGVQYDHPALVSQYRGRKADGTFDHNYNWYDPSHICGNPSLAPCDNNGHGTHTMGTAVGDDGGSNQIGVAPGAWWITAKGCEITTCSSSALLSSGQWILAPTDLNGQNPRPDLRPNIVNNSWGSDSGSDTFYRATVQAWVNAGIFPAFAIGNSGSSCSTAEAPGSYPESFGAGATDIFDNIASFSARGPANGFGGIIKPNVSAPGVSVRSSVPTNGYASFSGTSMATPHVSGVVALLWSANPSLIGNIAATEDALQRYADFRSSTQCGSAGPPNNVYGWGIINALAAVQNSLPTHILTIASSNPNSGVGVTISLSDKNGQGNGSTQFTRTYANNSAIALTAPATAGGNSFSGWSGCDSSSGVTCNVTMSADKTVTASYVVPTRTLTVASSNPSSGVSITVGPNDNNNAGNGTTQFTRIYNNNTPVTLTAPATATGNNFSAWSGCDSTSGTTCNVTMSADKTVTASYVVPTRTLTVASGNPSSGVSITVSPNDSNGQNNGATQFTRIYTNNTPVTLTAPATATGNNFSAWSGCDSTSGTTCNVTLSADKTVTAVYVATTWTFCANENQVCSFTGTKLVRYGAGTSFNLQTAINGISCDNATFGDPIIGTVKHCDTMDVTTPSHALTVISSNPSSGVSITVSPNDSNGQNNGATQFTRIYTNNTPVTLTAPATATGNNFSAWSGCDSTSGTTCNVTLSADKTVTAVYVATTWTFCANENQVCSFTGTKLVRYGAGTSFNLQTAVNGISCDNATFGDPIVGTVKHCDYMDVTTPSHALTVISSNPSSGVSITVSPNDSNGQNNGATQFTRIYTNNTPVTLTAPATATGNNFSAWSGCDSTSGTTCNVTLSADKTVTAVYVATTWTFCANENQVCSFTGTKLVRYGAGTSFNLQTAVNGISCDNATFGDPIVGTVKHCDTMDVTTPSHALTVISSNPSSGVSITVSPNDSNGQNNGATQFTRIYTNNTPVTLTAPATATGNNFSAWSGCDSTSGTTCNVTLSADKTVTAVYVATTWTFCANENQVCSFTGTKLVRYGAGTSFNLQTAINGISCDNAAFGDPIVGTVKHCDYTNPAP